MNTLVNLIVIYIACYIFNFIILSIRFWKVGRTFDFLLIGTLSLYGPQLIIIMLIFRLRGKHVINKFNIHTNDKEMW